MDFQNTVKLLSMIQRIYPNQVKMMEKEDFELTAKLWERVLWNQCYSDCTNALIVYAQRSRFAPQPSDLIEIIARKYTPEAFKSAELAWEEVGKAVKKFGFSRQKEALETLDKRTVRVVKNITWWTICYSERPDMVKKDFKQIYDNLGEVEQETLMVDQTRWLVEQSKKYNERIDEPNN